jgi:hypothetical protein
VLEYLASRLDPDTEYAEADVNALLVRFHDDYRT